MSYFISPLSSSSFSSAPSVVDLFLLAYLPFGLLEFLLSQQYFMTIVNSSHKPHPKRISSVYHQILSSPSNPMAVVIIRFFSFPEDFIDSLLVLIIDVFLLPRQAVSTSSSRLLDSSLGSRFDFLLASVIACVEVCSSFNCDSRSPSVTPPQSFPSSVISSIIQLFSLLFCVFLSL